MSYGDTDKGATAGQKTTNKIRGVLVGNLVINWKKLTML